MITQKEFEIYAHTQKRNFLRKGILCFIQSLINIHLE